MAKPIPATPTLYGKDAEAVLRELTSPPQDTPERRALFARADAIYARLACPHCGHIRTTGCP
jgi:hypothetical protein